MITNWPKIMWEIELSGETNIEENIEYSWTKYANKIALNKKYGKLGK